MKHRWSDPSRTSEFWTERVCIRCSLRKVTRHDAGPCAIPWTEFYEPSGLLVEVTGGRTPVCEPVGIGFSA